MYRVEVKVVGESTWSHNSRTYATRAEAVQAAESLAWRWTAVREWRVVADGDIDMAFGHAAWQRSLRDADIDG